MLRVKQDFDLETMEIKFELSLVNKDESFSESFKAGFNSDVTFIDGKFFISIKPNSVVKVNGKK